ncbi:MAG: hypothetical protein MI920_17635 [Kiloniellales bacterium]|nr:hypothetical protein [Kiloniellales bacterium]
MTIVFEIHAAHLRLPGATGASPTKRRESFERLNRPRLQDERQRRALADFLLSPLCVRGSALTCHPSLAFFRGLVSFSSAVPTLVELSRLKSLLAWLPMRNDSIQANLGN